MGRATCKGYASHDFKGRTLIWLALKRAAQILCVGALQFLHGERVRIAILRNL